MTKAQLKAWYAKIGKRGGKKTAERGPEYYRAIGAKGLKNRRKKPVHNSTCRTQPAC